MEIVQDFSSECQLKNFLETPEENISTDDILPFVWHSAEELCIEMVITYYNILVKNIHLKKSEKIKKTTDWCKA